jgi:hypothetical protein
MLVTYGVQMFADAFDDLISGLESRQGELAA